MEEGRIPVMGAEVAPGQEVLAGLGGLGVAGFSPEVTEAGSVADRTLSGHGNALEWEDSARYVDDSDNDKRSGRPFEGFEPLP